MKLASLKNNDDGFIELFKRLISLAKEIVVFDPDINPAKAETDVFFYFPCENPRHTDCGFFVWVVTILTAKIMFSDIEIARVEQGMTPTEVIEMTSDPHVRAFNIITSASFTQDTIPTMIRNWLSEWVEELKHLHIRLADYGEYDRAFARYEENHLEPEQSDLFYFEQRGLITREFYFNGKMMDQSDYFDTLHALFLEKQDEKHQKDEEDEDGRNGNM